MGHSRLYYTRNGKAYCLPSTPWEWLAFMIGSLELILVETYTIKIAQVSSGEFPIPTNYFSLISSSKHCSPESGSELRSAHRTIGMELVSDVGDPELMDPNALSAMLFSLRQEHHGLDELSHRSTPDPSACGR